MWPLSSRRNPTLHLGTHRKVEVLEPELRRRYWPVVQNCESNLSLTREHPLGHVQYQVQSHIYNRRSSFLLVLKDGFGIKFRTKGSPWSNREGIESKNLLEGETGFEQSILSRESYSECKRKDKTTSTNEYGVMSEGHHTMTLPEPCAVHRILLGGDWYCTS